MFQAAQKLGGYELVSIHICCNIFLLCPLRSLPPSLLSFFAPSLPPSWCLPSIARCLRTYLPPPSVLSLPSFCPLRPVTIFPRRKSCSEPHLAKMMPLFQPTPLPPTGVENTCSSALHWSEGNWSNRSFFPMLGMKWNAHTYTAHTHTHKHTTHMNYTVSQCESEKALDLEAFTRRLFTHFSCASCFQSEVEDVWCYSRQAPAAHARFFISRLV